MQNHVGVRPAARAHLTEANATFLASLYPGPRKEFMRAFSMARHDPLVVPVTHGADYSLPQTRAHRPPKHGPAAPKCGGVRAIEELDAPLFIASERARCGGHAGADRARPAARCAPRHYSQQYFCREYRRGAGFSASPLAALAAH